MEIKHGNNRQDVEAGWAPVAKKPGGNKPKENVREVKAPAEKAVAAPVEKAPAVKPAAKPAQKNAPKSKKQPANNKNKKPIYEMVLRKYFEFEKKIPHFGLICLAALGILILGIVLICVFAGKKPEAHTHSYEYSLEVTENNKFNLLGKCSAAGCSAPDYIEENIQGLEFVSSTNSTCSEAGTRVYKYVKDGKTLELTAYADMLPHTLNGKLVSEIANEDGSINCDVEGIELFAGSELVCGGTVRGFYSCEVCDGAVPVEVYKPHTGVWTVIVSAGCTVPGKQVVTCSECLEMYGQDDVAPVGHDYEYTLTAKSQEDVFDIIGKCKRSGCTDPDFSKKDVKAYLKEDVAPTCEKLGQKIYEYKEGDAAVTFTVEYGKLTSHTLNGVYADTLQNKDGSFNEDIGGIDLFANSSVNCGSLTNGYYDCEVCTEKVPVQVEIRHDYTYFTSAPLLINPTVTTAGKATIVCRSCNKNFEVVLPKVEIGKNAVVVSETATSQNVKYTYTTADGYEITFDLTLTK